MTVAAIALALALAAPPAAAPRDWYPPAKIFAEGMLKVSDLHAIHYELAGNPKGAPVFVLHGGPGGGSYPALRRYHDPRKWLIVLHDQRGSGKSTPYAETRENTTDDLVGDIEKLRAHLRIEKLALFGGSWGSTLALAYAEAHPDRVTSIVARGIFTCRRSEIDHFYHGGTEPFFPDAYAALRAAIPRPESRDWPRQLLELTLSADAAVRDRAVQAWALYETRVSEVGMTDAQAAKEMEGWDPLSFSRIENLYMANGCFLEEGRLLRDAPRLAGIPTVLVEGRYDMICPPVTAWEVHRAIPGSRIVFLEDAGHAGGAPPMRRALVEAARSVEPKVASKPAARSVEPKAASKPAAR